MADTISKLKAVSLIKQVEEIFPDKTSEQYTRLPSRVQEIVDHNVEMLSAYRFTYLSGKKHVVGYMIEPKAGKDPLPCVIWNRGGANDFSAIIKERLFYGMVATIARAGYIVIATQYAGNEGGEGKDEYGGDDLHDVLNLKTILDEYDRADSSRIGMYGASRGGMMTYLALKSVDWISAAVIVAGVTDLHRLLNDRPQMKDTFERMFGIADTTLNERSAVMWADKISKQAPILIMHGADDDRVSMLHALDISSLFYKYAIPHRLYIFEKTDHYLNQVHPLPIKEAIAWFDRFVKKEQKYSPSGQSPETIL